MAHIISVPCYIDERGALCVIDNLLPFDIKRVFYIFNVMAERGGHRHKKTIQALVCLQGSCQVYVHNGLEESNYLLNKNTQCLIVNPLDWHTMNYFSTDAVLLVLASECYLKEDYIYEPYR